MRKVRHSSKVAGYVFQFNRRQGIPVAATPSASAIDDVRRKYISMLDQEASEVKSGLDRRDLINTAQELADVVYVCYGAASELGIPLDEILELIHENNLGKPGSRRADGKILKSPDGPSIDLRRAISNILRRHGYNPNESMA